MLPFEQACKQGWLGSNDRWPLPFAWFVERRCSNAAHSGLILDHRVQELPQASPA